MHFPHPDIKIGETYNLRIHVIGKSDDFIIARPITQNGGYATCSFLEILHKYAPSFTPIPSEHGTSVPTTTRLFKKGDVVTPRIYLGRKDKGLEMGEKYIVTADEIAGDMVAIKHHFTLRPDIVQTCFLELVTPAEELEPYSIDPANTNVLFKRGKKFATFEDDDEAQELCDRLNAEYRKEQNNG